jgi:hypothetical protein
MKLLGFHSKTRITVFVGVIILAFSLLLVTYGQVKASTMTPRESLLQPQAVTLQQTVTTTVTTTFTTRETVTTSTSSEITLPIPFGFDLSPAYLLVLGGATCLFLIIGVGLGRIGSKRRESASPPAPPAMKSTVKTPPTRPVSPRKIEPATNSSAEEKLRRLLEQV